MFRNKLFASTAAIAVGVSAGLVLQSIQDDAEHDPELTSRVDPQASHNTTQKVEQGAPFRSPEGRPMDAGLELDSEVGAAATGAKVETWKEAKAALKTEFDLYPDQIGDFAKWAYEIDFILVGDERVAVGLNLKSSRGFDWLNEAMNPNRTELHEAAVEELEQTCSDYSALIEEAYVPALKLYQDALYQYWEQERYFKFRASDQVSVPKEFIQGGHGLLQLSYTVTTDNWRAFVCFDSGDFPVFEDSLREIKRIQNECVSALTGQIAEY